MCKYAFHSTWINCPTRLTDVGENWYGRSTMTPVDNNDEDSADEIKEFMEHSITSPSCVRNRILGASKPRLMD